MTDFRILFYFIFKIYFCFFKILFFIFAFYFLFFSCLSVNMELCNDSWILQFFILLKKILKKTLFLPKVFQIFRNQVSLKSRFPWVNSWTVPPLYDSIPTHFASFFSFTVHFHFERLSYVFLVRLSICCPKNISLINPGSFFHLFYPVSLLLLHMFLKWGGCTGVAYARSQSE